MTRTTRLRAASTGLGLAIGLALTSLAGAANAETFKMAHVYETTEPFHQWALWAADEIAKRTEGRHEVKVFPASTLGSEGELNEGLGLGLVDVIYTSPLFSAAAYPPIAISDAPYMFRDLDHWQAYADSPMFDDLSQGYRDATGNRILTLGYYGTRHTTANKPITTPADMDGMKLRVPGAPVFLVYPESVGASATPIAFAEVYLALQQGVVDGQENPLPTIKAKKFYEVQSDINLTGHITNGILTVMSGAKWDALSEEDKAIFDAVFTEAARQCTAEIRKHEGELAAWFEAQGVKVHEVDRAAFIAAVAPRLDKGDLGWSTEQYQQLQAIK